MKLLPHAVNRVAIAIEKNKFQDFSRMWQPCMNNIMNFYLSAVNAAQVLKFKNVVQFFFWGGGGNGFTWYIECKNTKYSILIRTSVIG